MYERDNNIGSIILAFAIGGLVGAGVALLMAPQSGPETRSMLKNKGTELKEKAVGTVEDTRARAEQVLDDVTSQTKERVSALKNRGQEKIEEQMSHLDDRLQAARK